MYTGAAEDFSSSNRIETGGWFVKYQEIRMHGNDTRYGDTALLSAGKTERRAACEFFIINAGKAHGAFDTLVHFFLVASKVLRPESDILRYGFFEELMLRVLEYHPGGMALGHGILRLCCKIDAVDGDFAARRMDEPVQMLDERGLAAPRMSDDADEFALIDREIDMRKRRLFKRGSFAVNVAYIFDTYGHNASPSSSSVRQSSGILNPFSRRPCARSAATGTSRPIFVSFSA